MARRFHYESPEMMGPLSHSFTDVVGGDPMISLQGDGWGFDYRNPVVQVFEDVYGTVRHVATEAAETAREGTKQTADTIKHGLDKPGEAASELGIIVIGGVLAAAYLLGS